MQQIATIGGGSGHAQVLKALRVLPEITITAICGSTDSGGSSGILKRDYGSLGYLGDLTRCIAALCPNSDLAKALLHRFDGGCLHGHSMKNILLLALECVHDSERALELMHGICGISPHRVIPVARERTELCAHLKAGNEIEGETNIDNLARNPLWNPALHAIEEVFLKPKVHASEHALESIRTADYCIICPGDLYSSILPVLIPKGMACAFRKSSATIIIMLNIMTKNGETHDYHAEDFIARIENGLGRTCDIILHNTTEIPRHAKFTYKLEKKVKMASARLENDQRLMKYDLATVDTDGRLFHDPEKLTNVFSKLFSCRRV